MKNLKYIYLSLAFVIVQGLTWYSVNQYTKSKIESLKNHELTIIQAQYDSIISTFENLANTVFNGYINKPHIIKNFNNENRQNLYTLLKEDYKYLQSMDFKQIHFHTKENRSFLRMHSPNKFGDDLTDFRYSVKYVNSTKKTIAGLEMGRIIPGFRFVYPIFDNNNQHKGSVETSFAIASFTKNLKRLYNVRTNFIIRKDIVKSEIFTSSSKHYSKSIESDGYLSLKQSVDSKILKNIKSLEKHYNLNLKDKIKHNLQSNKLFNIITQINGFHKIITFLPVDDIEQNHIGYFVVYKNSDQLEEYTQETITKSIISSIIIISLFLLLYKELRYKDSLKHEVNEKTKKLQETTVLLEEQTSELEEMNESLETRISIEVEKNAKQERELFQQSKQAALGDMIGNIAHQWRQPLSAISTSASAMKLTHMAGILNDEDLINYSDAIVNNSKYLSQTIDDFRDFIKSDKRIIRFDINHAINKCLAIVNSSINNHNLHIELDLTQDIFINNYENELQQSIINIFSNAKDILKERISNSDDRIVFIKTYQEDNEAVISIKDTAGGIDENIIEKIFEPYFTTKHQAQGTGLGLYMTHQIICDSMKGAINVENETFDYNKHTYTGANFTIRLKIL